MIRFLFYIIVKTRNWLYDSGLLYIYKSHIPTISVGNITTGGTGKTPFVMYLTKKVIDKGLRPLIISRGYKRSSKGLIYFNWGLLKKSQMGPSHVGDEPFLISKRFPGVDIIVNNNRVKAVQYAENVKKKYDIIILDDAFQHRAIHRDLDIVLINTNQRHSQLLPNGLLREPYKNISRADCVVLTKNSMDFNIKPLEYLNLPIFKCEENYSLSAEKKEGVAFCGIGNPVSFWKTLEFLSVKINKKIEFKDHQNYEPSTIQNIESILDGDNTFFTTEKDWIKLPQDFIDKFSGVFVKMDVEVNNKSFDNMVNKICQKN